MRSPRRVLAVCVLALCAAGVAAAQQNEIWYGRAPKLQIQSFQAPDGRFALEYPKKDWIVVPGGAASLATFTQQKGEASVVIEQTRLNQALGRDEITDLFAQLETDAVKERQPSAKDFKPKVIDAPDRRLIAVQFSRPGLKGQEIVRLYSIPVGQSLYRLTCSSQPAQFAKYEAVFAHFAASFKAAGGA